MSVCCGGPGLAGEGRGDPVMMTSGRAAAGRPVSWENVRTVQTVCGRAGSVVGTVSGTEGGQGAARNL